MFNFQFCLLFLYFWSQSHFVTLETLIPNLTAIFCFFSIVQTWSSDDSYSASRISHYRLVSLVLLFLPKPLAIYLSSNYRSIYKSSSVMVYSKIFDLSLGWFSLIDPPSSIDKFWFWLIDLTDGWLISSFLKSHCLENRC
jgi:hypothetical protein